MGESIRQIWVKLFVLFTENKAVTCYYENLPMQYTEIISPVKIEKFQPKSLDIFLIFAQNIDCGYTLEPPRRAEAVLTSTHKLCFGAKIRKICIPLHTPVLLYKSGV